MGDSVRFRRESSSPVARSRFWWFAGPLIGTAVLIIGLAIASLHAASGAGAYIQGESLWSKAQKDAVYFLARYAESRDTSDYWRYMNAIAVPLGDRKAREALDRPDPDYAAARAGFIEGGNHPDDVDLMSRIFVLLRNEAHMSKAIGIWERGDALIEALRKEANDLRLAVEAGQTGAMVRRQLGEIQRINDELRPLEEQFSATLGAALRQMRSMLALALGLAAAVLIAVALGLFRMELRRAEKAESALLSSKARLAFLAHHDSLTGLPNRILFNENAEQLLANATRHKRQLAIAFIDLDDFKKVNDTYGHAAGDEVLRRAATRLRACVRREDLVARIGGDEFCLLLTDLREPYDAATVAKNVLARVGGGFVFGKTQFDTTPSIGIACFPQDGQDLETLLRNADAAMYCAKDAGRNGFRFYSDLSGGQDDRPVVARPELP